MARKTLRRIRRSRTLRWNLVFTVIGAGFLAADALLPEFRDEVGPALYPTLVIAIAMINAWLRTKTTGPLSDFDAQPTRRQRSRDDDAPGTLRSYSEDDTQ